MSRPYNGHPSWAYWNVALWIGNDEPLYRLALDCLREYGTVRVAARAMVATLVNECRTPATPDGARYSQRAVAHALSGLKEEMQ